MGKYKRIGKVKRRVSFHPSKESSEPAKEAMLTPIRKGRSKYREEFLEQAYIACKELGATDKELGLLFGVDEKTIQVWRRMRPSFGEMVQRGKDEFDSEKVEGSLKRRALGYDYQEMNKVRMGNGKVKKTFLQKHVLPDVTACMFWLQNRQPERWKNVKYVKTDSHKVNDINLNILNEEKLKEMTEDELSQVRDVLASAVRDSIDSNGQGAVQPQELGTKTLH